MTKSYDYRGADSLIPLLQVLNREIKERTQAIQHTLRSIRRLKRQEPPVKPSELRHRVALLQSQISTHKLEIRMTKKELSRLGCQVDSADPSMVLIPGRDGNLETGFAWRSGETSVHSLVQRQG